MFTSDHRTKWGDFPKPRYRRVPPKFLGSFSPKKIKWSLIFWGLNNAIFLRLHPTWWIGGSKRTYDIWNIMEYPWISPLMDTYGIKNRSDSWFQVVFFFSNHSVSTKPLLKSEITSLASAGWGAGGTWPRSTHVAGDEIASYYMLVWIFPNSSNY